MADYKTRYLGADTPRGGGSSSVFPENQYGGFRHTLFLGCSVMEFSATVGWNQQVSELTVQLVEDDQSAPDDGLGKLYYDRHLSGRRTYGADPGFFCYNGGPPQVGSCVYFRVGDFEFAGLLQSWTKSSGSESIYTVKIVDPRQILENAQLIIGDYAGGVPSNLYNVFNVYGFAEKFNGYVCSSVDYNGVSFGSIAGRYGGADLNENGMPVSYILRGAQILTSAMPREMGGSYVDAYGQPFSPYGRLVYKGPDSGEDGYGVLPADYNGLSFYLLDISEVPFPPTYYRKRATSISIMELINEVASDWGFDYYVELIIISRGVSTPMKFIKVRTVSRSRQPVFGVIDDFVGDCETAGTLLATNRNKGRELRNEETASLVIGGTQQSIYQTTNPATIRPFFGLNPDGTAIYTQQDGDGYWYFQVDITSLATQLSVVPSSSLITIHEDELIVANNFNSWDLYIKNNHPDSLTVIFDSVKPAADWNMLPAALEAGKLSDDNLTARDLRKIKKDDEGIPIDSDILEDFQKVYTFIHTIATNFYGKKFIVDIPFTCYYTDTEAATYTGEAKVQYTDIPCDGGWAWTNTVIDLPHPSQTTRFLLDDNRLGPFVKFSGLTTPLDFSSLDQGDYVYYDAYDTLYVKAQIEDQLVFFSSYYDPSLTPKVVIEIPQVISDIEKIPVTVDTMKRTGSGMAMAIASVRTPTQSKEAVTNANEKPAGIIIKKFPRESYPKFPDKAAVPLQNTTRTYGPWATSAFSLPAGTVRIEKDDGLTPWNYGNGIMMYTAGQGKANANLTRMQTGETGEITVLGYPDIPLGAELGARTIIRRRYLNINTRTSFNYNQYGNITYIDNAFNIPAGTSFGKGIYGPNITSINVQVGPRGIQTTYTLKTFTTTFGRMEKYNSDRLRNLGNNLFKQQKQIYSLLQDQRKYKERQAELFDKRERGMQGSTNNPTTSHELFVGQIIPHPVDSELSRTIISTSDMSEIPHELTYATNKSIASFDALIRPISIRGEGDLPRYASYTVGDVKGHDPGAQPPVTIGETDCYNLEIDADYYNPFGNPSSLDTKTPVLHSETPAHGHDIDVVMRTYDDDQGTLVMPVEGADTDQRADWKSDYRTFGLRGPLVMHGWGYDTDGKPIPNQNDIYEDATQGTFAKIELTDKFMDDFMQKSLAWPVGPVDLRFDRKRGMWVAAPSYRLIVGKLKEDISPDGEGEAEMIDGSDLYDDQGVTYTPEEGGDITFTVVDKLGMSHSSGDKFFGYYNPDVNEYWMLKSSGGGGGLAISDSGCNDEPNNLFVNDWRGKFLDIDRLVASTGLQIGSTGTYNDRGTEYTYAKMALQLDFSYPDPDTGEILYTFSEDEPSTLDYIHFNITGITVTKDPNDDCRVNIGCSGLMDTIFCLVSDVYCQDNNVVVEKISLEFNECGWLISTGIYNCNCIA